MFNSISHFFIICIFCELSEDPSYLLSFQSTSGELLFPTFLCLQSQQRDQYSCIHRSLIHPRKSFLSYTAQFLSLLYVSIVLRVLPPCPYLSDCQCLIISVSFYLGIPQYGLWECRRGTRPPCPHDAQIITHLTDVSNDIFVLELDR